MTLILRGARGHGAAEAPLCHAPSSPGLSCSSAVSQARRRRAVKQHAAAL